MKDQPIIIKKIPGEKIKYKISSPELDLEFELNIINLKGIFTIKKAEKITFIFDLNYFKIESIKTLKQINFKIPFLEEKEILFCIESFKNIIKLENIN